MQQTVIVKAGQLARVQATGSYAAIIITGASTPVSVAIKIGNQLVEELRTVGRSLTVRTDTPFSAVELRAAVDTVCEVVVTNGRVTVDTLDGSTIKVTADTPLPVSNDRGTPGNLLHVAGVTLADAPATAIASAAPIACGPAGVVIAVADATRRELRFTNLGPDPVALGGAGQTWANRCLVLEVGDTWVEDRAANLAWSGVTDAGKAASVTTQRVTA